jgi:hypothetical protein
VSRYPHRRTVSSIGVVVPVHDEEELLPEALRALERAIAALPRSVSCRVAVVVDDCEDGSWAIARCWAARGGVLVIRRKWRNVGLARRTGFVGLMAGWPESEHGHLWLATTDGDSRVPADWLTVQLEAYASGADLWAGRVGVDCSNEGSASMQRWAARYAAERAPIHGASLGFTAGLYSRIGGFRPLPSGEDRDLHDRAAALGFRIAYDSRATVTTSSRRTGRAPYGFASVLERVAQEELEETA